MAVSSFWQWGEGKEEPSHLLSPGQSLLAQIWQPEKKGVLGVPLCSPEKPPWLILCQSQLATEVPARLWWVPWGPSKWWLGCFSVDHEFVPCCRPRHLSRAWVWAQAQPGNVKDICLFLDSSGRGKRICLLLRWGPQSWWGHRRWVCQVLQSPLSAPPSCHVHSWKIPGSGV